MSSIWRITLTGTLYSHLDVADAAGKLSEIIPGKGWG